MSRALMQTLARLAALLVLFAGLVGVAKQIAEGFRNDRAPVPWDRQLHSLHGPLWLCLFAGLLYVLPGIDMTRLQPRRLETILQERRGPFDFQSTFGPYIYRESPLRRVLRWLLALACFVVGLAVGLISQNVFREPQRWPGAVLGIGWGLGVVSPMLLVLGVRLVARRAESVLRRNRRRPVLYLRSFKSDAGLLEGLDGFLRLVFLMGYSESPELALTRAVRNIGPLVAVGRPGEQLPSRGAARLYVRDDWQGVVARMADEAALVIFRIGNTEGFWWEIERAVRSFEPRRVFLYLPMEDRGDAYALFRQRAAALFPHELPERVDGTMFLAFGAGWEPRLLREEDTPTFALLRAVLTTRAAQVRDVLNPALRKLGLNSKPLPLLWGEYVMFFVMAGLALQCCGLMGMLSR